MSGRVNDRCKMKNYWVAIKRRVQNLMEDLIILLKPSLVNLEKSILHQNQFVANASLFQDDSNRWNKTV